MTVPPRRRSRSHPSPAAPFIPPLLALVLLLHRPLESRAWGGVVGGGIAAVRGGGTNAADPSTGGNTAAAFFDRPRTSGPDGPRRVRRALTPPTAAFRPSRAISGLRGGGGGPLRSLLSPEAIAAAETIVPKIGILTSTALYFAPAAAVLAAVRNDDMGDLNPIPLIMMSVASISWLAYGLSARDPYVTLSNAAGCVGSIGYVVFVLPLLRDRMTPSSASAAASASRRRLRVAQGTVMAGSASTLALWTYLGLSGTDRSGMTSALGKFASLLFVILSGSPLSALGTVLRTGDSTGILGSLTIAQVVNTSLWSAYGLAVGDGYVWGPNVIGLVLGLAQLALKVTFPSSKSRRRKGADGDDPSRGGAAAVSA